MFRGKPVSSGSEELEQKHLFPFSFGQWVWVVWGHSGAGESCSQRGEDGGLL